MTIAFIAGSGLAAGLESVLPDMQRRGPVTTPYGEVPVFFDGRHHGTRVIILPRHGEDIGGKPQRSPAELVRTRGYEANAWFLGQNGAREAYGFSAVGSLETDLPLADAGVFVVPNSYGRGFAASQHSFGTAARVVHAGMRQPFDEGLRLALISATERAGLAVARSNPGREARGLYIYNGGDCFETPEEIIAISRLYAGPWPRVVGMTTVPEAQLLAQLGIPFAALCSNVNYAEGLSPATIISHEQTLRVMKAAGEMIARICSELILAV